MTPAADSSQIHLAIIPDGNRRWAKKRLWEPWKGHEHAVENFRSILEWCRKNPRISTVTIWCFSTENWNRSKEEVQHLMEIYEDFLGKEREKFIKEKTRFAHSGRLDRIPASLATLIRTVEEETKDQKEFTLHLAIDYGGKDEIARAAEKLRAAGGDIPVNEKLFRTFMDHPEIPDIDIVVRTSGEQRISNFFLWQAAYSEWIFTEKLFPELTTDDLTEAIVEFDKRTRRFGG